MVRPEEPQTAHTPKVIDHVFCSLPLWAHDDPTEELLAVALLADEPVDKRHTGELN